MRPDHAVALALHGKATGAWNHGCVPELNRKGANVLYTLAVILLILWLLGMVGSYTLGGLIHILLVVALVMIVVNLVSGRRAL
jgi:uncharacterized membrane protein YtjA (UPF0391 family)